jgi:hypothetical protein
MHRSGERNPLHQPKPPPPVFTRSPSPSVFSFLSHSLLSLSDFTSLLYTRLVQVVNFMRQLSDHQSTVESFLGVLGAGNWGGPSKNSAVGGAVAGEEGGMIGRYLSAFFLSFSLPSFSFEAQS